jgi:hypothetical protein
MFAWFAGCAPEPVRQVGPSVVQPSPLAPFARLVHWELDRDVTVTLEASDGVHERSVVAGPGRVFDLPLIGLYPDREWTVRLEAAGDGVDVRPDPISFATGPLPGPFPEVSVRVPSDDPGLTLVSLTAVPTATWLVAFDAAGEVAWLYDAHMTPVYEAHPFESADGGGVRMLHGSELAEIDWLGRDRRRLKGALTAPWEPAATPVTDALAFTHELAEGPDGHWVVADKEARRIPGYPTSYEDPDDREDQLVAGDVLEEIDPDTATIVRRWSLFDHLDPRRIGYGALDPTPGGADWSHVNSVSVRGDEWLGSARHQDAVFLVDGQGELDWILANPDNWPDELRPKLPTPVGEPFEWFWHQHAAKWLDGDRVTMFDNGNFRSSPWTGAPQVDNASNRSRVVEYSVDRAARTVRQDWSFELDPPVFSGAMGDADELPDGRVLATYAYVLYEGGVPNHDLGRQTPSVRVVEFDPATSEVTWDLDLWAGLRDPRLESGWWAFRAERFAGFDQAVAATR